MGLSACESDARSPVVQKTKVLCLRCKGICKHRMQALMSTQQVQGERPWSSAVSRVGSGILKELFTVDELDFLAGSPDSEYDENASRSHSPPHMTQSWVEELYSMPWRNILKFL